MPSPALRTQERAADLIEGANQARRDILPFLRVKHKEEFCERKNTIKDLENQAANTKHYMDKLNKAYYGMTWDECIRLLGTQSKEEKKGEKQK